MLPLIYSLFLVPVFISLLVLILSKSQTRILIIISSFVLSAIALYLFITIKEPVRFGLPQYMDEVMAGIDMVVLLFFGWVAIRQKSGWVGLLTILQLGALSYLLPALPAIESMQFRVDKLTVFMFLLINVISSIIAVFSVKYIDGENCSNFRKKYFMSLLFGFIAVMNGVVSSDNLDYFFLFFELTTLASFLFIGFRKDATSVKNAVTALWMNQIGGLAILVAIYFIRFNGYGVPTFSNVLAHSSASGILLPLALLSMAALIKGAQMPFSKWLLGAMVAPTPVSALLHSSTMVKIAPFMILRLSPALKDTPVASVLIALTGFVFIAAAIGALSQDNFKRILAHSTIALLALMIMMAAVGTPVTLVASLTLVFFHGISKSLLFLNAGILERVFHFKETSDMDKLGETGPFTAFVITIGFMSLLLPPFGAFIGKWFSIETLGTLAINQKLLGALVIVAIACGGAILSLLYFKVLGVLIARTGNMDALKWEHANSIYSVIIYILLGFIMLSVIVFPFLLTDYFVPVASQTAGMSIPVSVVGFKMHIGAMALPIIPLLIAFLLLPVTIITSLLIKFKHVDRAKEYMCGESVEYSFSSLYFSTEKATPYFYSVGILLFMALIIVAVL